MLEADSRVGAGGAGMGNPKESVNVEREREMQERPLQNGADAGLAGGSVLSRSSSLPLVQSTGTTSSTSRRPDSASTSPRLAGLASSYVASPLSATTATSNGKVASSGIAPSANGSARSGSAGLGSKRRPLPLKVQKGHSKGLLVDGEDVPLMSPSLSLRSDDDDVFSGERSSGGAPSVSAPHSQGGHHRSSGSDVSVTSSGNQAWGPRLVIGGNMSHSPRTSRPPKSPSPSPESAAALRSEGDLRGAAAPPPPPPPPPAPPTLDDPPSRLIEAFLRKQRESGEEVIDMDLSLSMLPDYLPRPEAAGERVLHSPAPMPLAARSAPLTAQAAPQGEVPLSLPGGGASAPRLNKAPTYGDGEIRPTWEDRVGPPDSRDSESIEMVMNNSGLLRRRRPSEHSSGPQGGGSPLKRTTSRVMPPALPSRLKSRASRMDDPTKYELVRTETLTNKQRSGMLRHDGVPRAPDLQGGGKAAGSGNFSRNLQRHGSGATATSRRQEEGPGVGGSRKSGPILPRSGALLRPSGMVSGHLSKVDEDDDPFQQEDVPDHKKKHKESWVWVVLEWISLVLIVGALCVCLVFSSVRNAKWLTIRPWKWTILLLVFFCGRLVSGWLVGFVVFIIERNFLLRTRVLYFVYGIKRGVRNWYGISSHPSLPPPSPSLWLGLGLLVWHLIFDPKVNTSDNEEKALHWIARGFDCAFIAAIINLLKLLLLKVIASRFHVAKYFERIRDALFNQYVLDALSGPPLDTNPYYGTWGGAFRSPLWRPTTDDSDDSLDRTAHPRTGADTDGHDYGKDGDAYDNDHKVYDKDQQEQGSGQGRKEGVLDGVEADGRQKSGAINIEGIQALNQDTISAWSMKKLMRWVRANGVATYTDAIEEEAAAAEAELGDQESSNICSEFQAKDAARHIFENVAKPNAKYIVEEDFAPFMKEDEVGKAWALFDGSMDAGHITKRVLKDWVVVFMFGNTAKTTFESLVFLFIMHPFDVGDRCVIDGNQSVRLNGVSDSTFGAAVAASPHVIGPAAAGFGSRLQ
eukprot:jgi/Mesen1/7807/ME000408S06916